MTEDKIDYSKNNIIGYHEINQLTRGIAIIIPSIVGYFIVLFFTSVIELLASRLWSLPIIWPEALYIGSTLGGLMGGLIGLWEIYMFHSKKQNVESGKIFSQDLYYIIALIIFTYILEFLSDSFIPQSILFFLEIGFFLIIGWNLTKILLETETKITYQENQIIEDNKKEENEIENYNSE